MHSWKLDRKGGSEMKLVIYFEHDCPDGCLARFPFLDGQYIYNEGQGPAGFHSAVWIDLGEKETTSAQEIFLNTCESVSSYSVF